MPSSPPSKLLLVANFGGPRDLDEIPSFLTALLTDREVIRTPLPKSLNHFLFTQIAKRRSLKIRHDYQKIGGKSPIYFDTEAIAQFLHQKLHLPILTFHRYLPTTHPSFLSQIEKTPHQEIIVFPLFPQFSYATTGSIARFFQDHLSATTLQKIRWIHSYPDHPSYIAAFQKLIAATLHSKNWKEEETILFFSAHGLPQKYVDQGDPYQKACESSYTQIKSAFPKTLTKLAYQSKFGPGKWLTPATDAACQSILTWNQNRKKLLVIPLSFTSDHIETLFEIEELYLPPLKSQGLTAERCPALNLEPYWLDACAQIIETSPTTQNQSLLRIY